PFLPSPLVVKKDAKPQGEQREPWDPAVYALDYGRPKSIGRVRSFFGNVGILLRGWLYIRTLGPAGLREMTENAVLNANYLLARVKNDYEVPYGDRCMHEFVASALRLKRQRGIS